MERKNRWWLLLLEGLVAIGLGLFMMFDQTRAGTSLGLIIAAYIAITGLLQTIGAFWNQGAGSSTVDLIRGLVGLISGGIILVFYFFNMLAPNVGITILGIALIVYGGLGLYQGFFARSGKPFTWAGIIVNGALVLWGVLMLIARSQDIPLTLWSGLILLVVGVIVAIYGFMSRKPDASVTA